MSEAPSTAGLTKPEIVKVVNRYIGVSGGYLGDFTYRTHEDFYPEYCDLIIDPYAFDGNTTRERFVAILESRSPQDQARILRGVVERFPVTEDGLYTRSAAMRSEILRWAERLESSGVLAPEVAVTSEVVRRALADAETLLRSSDATSAVDRAHTALHGYLIWACDQAGIEYPEDATTVALLKTLRKGHPGLQGAVRQQDIDRVLNSAAAILDALNPLRNRASVAHPNSELLEPEEAMLVLNVVRTLFTYLDAKLT